MLPVQRVAIVTMEHPVESADADLPCDDSRNAVAPRDSKTSSHARRRASPNGLPTPSFTVNDKTGSDPLMNERVRASATQRNELEEVTILDMSDNNVQAKITPGDGRTSMAKITPNDGAEG